MSHLFYKYSYGVSTSLSSTIMIDGVPTMVNTTLPTYTIKQLHRWSLGGYNPLVACFDGKGSKKSRNYYVLANNLTKEEKYKGNRPFQDDDFYMGIDITINMLYRGGVTVLKGENYEADDLIKAAVDKAKIDYPDLPIDVITGDVDLTPLVDDQVSVFLTSKKTTWAESKDLEKRHYIQLTPYNIQDYMEGLTEFKNLKLPYNTVLLKKILRGDPSDKICGVAKLTPTKFNKIIDGLIEDGYDLGSICRYDSPTVQYVYKDSGLIIPPEMLNNIDVNNVIAQYGEPPCLTKLKEALSKYLTPDEVDYASKVYTAINLNGAFTDVPVEYKRRPASVKIPIKGYVASELQQVVAEVQINLPIF